MVPANAPNVSGRASKNFSSSANSFHSVDNFTGSSSNNNNNNHGNFNRRRTESYAGFGREDVTIPNLTR